jgi:hypothetical protein
LHLLDYAFAEPPPCGLFSVFAYVLRDRMTVIAWDRLLRLTFLLALDRRVPLRCPKTLLGRTDARNEKFKE